MTEVNGAAAARGVNVGGARIVPGRVSVVIPAGQVDAWLGEAIESALASAYPDLEIVVVVNTADADAAPLPDDPRVTVVRYPHRLGIARANQRCMELATGEYVLHLDADDLADEARVERQAAYLREHPSCVAVGCLVATMDAHGERVGEMQVHVGPDVRPQLTRWNVLAHSATAFRASAVAQVGGYDQDLTLMEDYGLLLKLGMLGEVAVLDEELARYRLHDEQLSRGFRPFGHYMRVIMRRRTALARHIGVPPPRRLSNDLWYVAVQWGMFLNGRVQGLLAPLRRRLRPS